MGRTIDRIASTGRLRKLLKELALSSAVQAITEWARRVFWQVPMQAAQERS
jgi:hypothetical protein